MNEPRADLVDLIPDGASFRDPSARVLHQGNRVFRLFTQKGAEEFRQFFDSGLIEQWAAKEWIIESRVCDFSDLLAAPEDTSMILEHPRIPFVSYPYEWSFRMLQAAALLELDLLRDSIKHGFILKDATPYNVQFIGRRPIHIDPPSFVPWKEGSMWEAYSQFCRLFLNPLLVTSLTGMRFQPLLRGRLEGIPPSEINGLLPWYKKIRPGILTHVTLQSWIEKSFSDASAEISQAAKTASMTKERLIHLATKLHSWISTLKPRKLPSAWADYEQKNSYNEQGREFKETFVHESVSNLAPRLIWDIGCNTGRYTAIAARSASYVMAFDEDPAVVDLLFERLNREKIDNVLSLVNNVLDPSSNRGWNNEERPALARRGQPDFFLCLALVHHLAIGGNVPLSMIVEWLSNLSSNGIVEFIPKNDPMVRRLLQWRSDVFPDYSVENFEALLAQHFQIQKRMRVPGSDRVLYALAK